MPSKRSPSQRTPEGRQGRLTAAQTLGSNAGRLISASRRTMAVPSPPTPVGSGAGGVTLDTLIKQGPAGIATNVFPAGTRVPADCTTTGWFLRCHPSHGPTGSACTVAVKRSGSTIATISISAGATSGTVSTAVALTAGDLLTYDFSSVGSTTPAWDVACQIIGA